MPELSLPLKLLLCIVLGATIGLERESSFERKVGTKRKPTGKLGGIRTYSIITFVGGLAGFLSLSNDNSLALLLSITFFALIVSYYVLSSLLTKSIGLTTELAALISFLIGYFITSEIFSIQLVISITIVIGLILSVKEKAKNFVLGIKKGEIDAFLGFAIIALVILPFLPNRGYSLGDIPAVQTLISAYGLSLDLISKVEIINPFRLWLIVALVTGIDVFGYLLGKIAGKKRGVLLTSAIGGFISSTTTTQSLAQQSKKSKRINELVSAAVFANLTSFLQIFVLLAPLNGKLLVFVTPTILIIVATAFAIGSFFNFHKKEGGTESISSDSKTDTILSLGPAIRFAIILVVVRALTKVSLVVFGQSGFLFSSVIASFAGIDAIIINLAELSGEAITYTVALLTFILVNATNLLSKSVYAFFQAEKEFALKFFASVLFIIATSFIGYLLVFI